MVKRIGIVLFLLFGASPAQAITLTFGDIEITPEPAPKGNSSHGYTEYVFLVHNKSTERPHTVSLSIPFEKRYLRGTSIRELRRTMPVEANGTVRLSLLQPDHPPISGPDVEVTIDGRRQERELPLHVATHYRRYGHGYGYPGGGELLILLGPHVQPFPTVEPIGPVGPGGPGMPGGMMGAPAMPPGMGGPPGGFPMPGGPPGMAPGRPPAAAMGGPGAGGPADVWVEQMLLPLVLPPLWDAPSGLEIMSAWVIARESWEMGEWSFLFAKAGLSPRGLQFVNAETWSSDWLAYSRYDGIVITAADLKTLPAEVRTALWQYVETGGALLVLGMTELPGLSAITDRTPGKAGWTTVRAGFGVCEISPDANYAKWDASHFAKLEANWSNVALAWWGRGNPAQPNQAFPVIEDLGIPIRGLFVLMFLFTLAIGPINLLVLTHRKRRIWLLWTTPVISLCTCVAVFGYMLISEGWQGRLRSDTLTLLDETTHRATTIGWTGVYSPLTPGDGLHFQYETEVISQQFDQDGTGTARSCTIDWSWDQHLASGWVEARVPAHFKVRKSEMRRERVSLQRERDGRWSMVNGLGAAIRRFWYADEKGQIHAAENIAAGARAPLTLTEMECQVRPRTVQSLLSDSSWNAGVQQTAPSSQVNPHPEHYLRPHTYLAEMDDSPFLEEPLRNAKGRKLHSLILGFHHRGE